MCCSLLVLPALVVACDELTGKPAPDAAAPKKASDAAAPPTGEGCSRSGTFEAVENDPHCWMKAPPEDAMRDFAKRFSIAIAAEPDEVMSGSSVTLRVTLTNVAPSESLVVLEQFTRAPGARPDWGRIMGVPDARQTDAPHLYVTVRTLDSRNNDVDGVPTVAGTAVAQAPARLLGVRLKPGEKLTHTMSWWALRIPAAPPPVTIDDAGHRFFPKTGATPLWPADYIASVELPLHGVIAVERTVAARVHVVKSTAVVVPTQRKPPPPPPVDDGGAGAATEDASALDAARLQK